MNLGSRSDREHRLQLTQLVTRIDHIQLWLLQQLVQQNKVVVTRHREKVLYAQFDQS